MKKDFSRIRISIKVEHEKAEETLEKIRNILSINHIYLDTSAIDLSPNW